jgi:hypothetical protein
LSTFGSPILGGYGFGYGWGFGPLAAKVDAPPDSAAKAEPGAPLERNEWAGFATAQMGLPGFTKAPPGTDALYWEMCKYSACVLAYAVTTGPIFGGTRTLEICKEDGTPAAKRPGGPLAGDGPAEGPEDKIKSDMERHFEPLWPDILNGLEKLNFGRWLQEVEWRRKGNLTLPADFRDFTPRDRAGILYDAHGDFVGVRYNNQDLAPQYVLHHVHQRHRDRLDGYPRLENCRADWWANHNTEEKLGRAENKAAGISLLIHFDREYKFTDSAGNKVSATTVGQTVLNALSTGGTALVPRHAFDKKTIEGKPELAEHKPVEATGFDWGQTAPAILACLSVLDARDTRIIRSYGRPERESTEGKHGTKAEAGIHGQIGVLDCEKVHAELVRDFNRQTWRTCLLTNFGDKYVDRLYWKPTPLADDSKTFLQTAALAMLAAPGDPLPAQVDRKALLQKVELPYDESYVPPPALPAGPTPPEGGPGGGIDGQPQPGANGNGNPDRMRQLGLSAGGRRGDEADGPFDDDGSAYALALNCGTGAGGFQGGNTCSRGGRQYVVSRVTRAGMVHGRAADESPDVPPVELGHASEFTAAGGLADAPLPEFAARVQVMADNLGTGFGDNKVLVADAFEAARKEDAGLSLSEFKGKLKAAAHEGYIRLSRADLTSAFHPDDLRASSVNLAPGRAADAADEVGGAGNTAELILVKSRERWRVRGAK